MEIYRKIRISWHFCPLAWWQFVRKRVRFLTRNLTRNLRDFSKILRGNCGRILRVAGERRKLTAAFPGFFGIGDKKDQNREKPHKSRVSGQLASGICEVSREKWCEKSHAKSPRKLTENLREIYTIIRDRVKDRERDKDIIIARSSNLLRSLASKPVPEFPMKGLPDHGYLEPGEPIAIRGDRASDDE